METPEADASFARALGREIVASEVLRARVMAATLAVLLVIVTLAFIVGHNAFQQFATKPVSWWLPLQIAGPFLLYECLFLFGMSFFAARGRRPPRPSQYGNAVIETSLPTAILLVACGYADPAIVLGGWPSLLYFVFILAATLRLNFALPMFTGVVAAVEYTGLAVYELPLSLSPDQATLSLLYYVSRSVIMLMAGFVAGLVAIRLRAKLVRVLEESATREHVINLFGQHVSPSVVDQLLGGGVAAEGEAREVCVMFLDIRDFTAFARRRTPAEVVDFLNRAFAFMIEAVDRHHGIINKFLGDGFMAIFGAPLSDPGASAHAVEAARAILGEIDRRAASGADDGALRVGIGLHSGVAITGNIGSPRRKEFTVIGDIVNLASRIEQLNKEFGSRLLVSDAVAGSLGPALGDAQRLSAEVKGYADPITVWRLA